MSSGLGLSAATEVGIKKTPNSASLNAGVGVGGLSARLDINMGTGESGSNGSDALTDNPETSTRESLLKNEAPTLDGTDMIEAVEKPEAQSPDATDKTKQDEKTEAQTPDATQKPEAQTPDATDKTEVEEKPEAQTPDATDKTEVEEKPEAQTPDATEKPEAQTPDATDKTEVEEKPEAQTPDATDKTEVEEKPEAQTPDATDKSEVEEKPEAQSPDATDKTEVEENPEAQNPDATDKTEQDEKPEAQTPDATEKPEAQSPDATDKTEVEKKPEAATPDATDKTETEEKPGAQHPGATVKPEAQTSDTPEKTELEDKHKVQTPEATVKTQKKPEASVTENSEMGEGKSDSAPADGSDEAKPERNRSCENERPDSQRGFRIFGVEFAPLNTPMRRRLQTLAVLQWLLSITVMPVICVIFIGLTLFTPLAPLSLAYIGWVLFFDRNTSQRGGRRWERIRRWSLWRHYRDYFPIRLVKSADLDPAHNYLIGYHPHGIISCGAFCNFGTEATGFSAKFPGIKPYLLTLRLNFYWPLLRGYYLATGVCDVSRSSLQWILNREEGGNAAVIVVGGAQEALDARPGNYKLTLLKRKGFARMALQTGAHLVPCFSFGENDLFRQAENPPGSWVRAFQQIFKGAMGSSPPLFYGRGVFNYTFGLLPFRRAVTTVIGAPIPVEKCAEPTAEQVDRLHRLYMDRLADLFDEHKVENGVEEKVRLEFV